MQDMVVVILGQYQVIIMKKISFILALMATFGQNVELDTNIYPAKDQNISLLGKLNYSSHPKMDMSIQTADIKFNDMLILGKAFLDSLAIYNELDKISATGALKADCNIKTNFKKLRSSGSIIVKNGGINVEEIQQYASYLGESLSIDDINYGLMYGRSVIAEFLC